MSFPGRPFFVAQLRVDFRKLTVDFLFLNGLGCPYWHFLSNIGLIMALHFSLAASSRPAHVVHQCTLIPSFPWCLHPRRHCGKDGEGHWGLGCGPAVSLLCLCFYWLSLGQYVDSNRGEPHRTILQWLLRCDPKGNIFYDFLWF